MKNIYECILIYINIYIYLYLYINARTLNVYYTNATNNKFYFIMGEDSLKSFDTWKKPEIICKYASIIVAVRSNNNDLSKLIADYARKLNGEFILLKCNYIDIYADYNFAIVYFL